MNALDGVVTHLAEPETLSYTSSAWWENIKNLGVSHARVRIYGNSHNALPVGLYQQAVSSATASGINLICVLDNAFSRPWLEGDKNRVIYPNEPLGYMGNKRQNRYIKEFSVRAGRIAKALAPFKATRFSIYNEANLLGIIHAGANVPVIETDKAPAMAPETFFSLGYEVSGYLTANGATETHLGSLSWIAGSGMDQRNGYCAAYLRAGLAYLKATGVKKLPWTALSLNVEGYWTKDAAQQLRSSVSTAFTSQGFTPLPLVFGEWGVKYSLYNAFSVEETYHALRGIAAEQYFNQHPMNVEGYGMEEAATFGHTILPTKKNSTKFMTAIPTLVRGGTLL